MSDNNPGKKFDWINSQSHVQKTCATDFFEIYFDLKKVYVRDIYGGHPGFCAFPENFVQG